MTKSKLIKNHQVPRWAFLAVTLISIFSLVVAPVVVQANLLNQQINELKTENNVLQGQSNSLSVEADSLEGAIAALQSQINAIQAQINDSNAQIAQTEQKIVEAQAELDRQRDILGQNIRAMYLEGDISTMEMLASSKDLNEYLDKQQYRNSVQDKIKEALDRVTALKLQLKSEKERLEAQKKDQEARQTDLASRRAEQAHLLGLNQAQKASVDAEIRANSARIMELRRQQAIENAKLGDIIPGSSAACGGGYPGSTPNQSGNRWGCNHSMNNTTDNWGMYNRQCVSYTAYKVAASGRHMPYWGGKYGDGYNGGNAKAWDENAIRAGIPVDTTPRAGDVAVSNTGDYGHTMYVEEVYSDGRILISEYNQGWDGKYTSRIIKRGNLVFIHFP